MQDWQSWAALAVVILTALVFVAKRVTKKPGSCGHDCGCGKEKQKGG
jgi:hypothetical protein